MKPGIYDMPAEAYHADPCPIPSLSSSVARTLLARSPKHAWTEHPRLNPRYESEEKKEFDLGKAAHALLLEGEDRMQVIPFDSYRKAEAQVQRDAARAAGKHPVLEANYQAVVEMVAAAKLAIAANRDLSGLTLADGKAEQTLVWQEGEVWCRARLDWIDTRDLSLFIDYKTTSASAHPDDFVRTLISNGYDFQDAFYRRGLAAVRGREGSRCVFLVQEVEPPYACSFPALSPAFLELARDKVDEAVATWTECMRTQEWPAYPTGICYLEPPAWHVTRWEERRAVQQGNPTTTRRWAGRSPSSASTTKTTR
jgi:hypothetical protein